MDKNSKKIGFIYVDELPQIHHFLSPAIELSKLEGIKVDILTYEGNHDYLINLMGLLGGDEVNIIMLGTYLYRKIIERINNRSQPSPLYIYKKHTKKLLQYDALVFTDWTASVLYKAREPKEKPLLCFIEHGSGDRAYGYGETNNLFDLVVVGGSKKLERLKRVIPDHKFNIKIGGYSKFDVVKAETTESRLFNNSRPIILYAPHFSRELSSWYVFGESILDYFMQNPGYNLIFAPHFNLFNKKGFVDPTELSDKYFSASNIHIDLGSIRSVNMTYTLNSDIYLGDVSSQAYEFMYKTRPLIFFNTYKIDWHDDENYTMWQSGKVVESVDELSNALLTVDEWSTSFEKKQKDLFDMTFDLKHEASGSRVARLIEEELNSQI